MPSNSPLRERSPFVDRVGDAAELRIRDTGVGIPAEAMPRLFERFHRIPNTRSRTYEGSGIGLALVHELVLLHGGSIRVDSALGHGSTFIVKIPLGQDHLAFGRVGGNRPFSSIATGAMPFVEEALRWLPDAKPSSSEEFRDESLPVSCPPISQGPSAARPRLVVADDNPDMRQYLVRLLAERFEVEAVPDGQAALAATRRCLPDLILSDVMMPKLDGLGLLGELRTDPSLEEIPIIFLSARAGEENRLEGVESGADDYLVKPFSARELIARVEAHVKMRRMRQQAKLKQQQLTTEYETLLNQAPLGIYLVDSAFRIRQVNPVAFPFFGNIPNLIGRSFDEVMQILWTKEYVEELVRVFRHTLETGEPFAASERAEYRIDRGVTEYYEWRVDRITLPEGGYGVVCYFRDISAQVRARMAVEDSQERFRELAETLEQQVRARTKELEQRNTDITKHSEEVRKLSARLLKIQDDERRRIARELHDSAGQTLAVLGMQLGKTVNYAKAIAPQLAENVEESHALVRRLVQEIRTTSYLLHPPLLDERGLSSALAWYIEGVGERTGLDTKLIIPDDLGELGKDVELVMFRLVQECLTNILRHSESKNAVIRILLDAESIYIEVQDTGKGIPPDKLAEIRLHRSGVGIQGMRERVLQLNGEMTIESDASGTKISFTLPLTDHSSSGQSLMPLRFSGV